ncbi:MAG: thioredoxin family protein [Ferruginibacter sp.]
MKKNCLMVLLLLIIVTDVSAQAQYEITKAENHNQQKVLRGFINKYLVMNDTAFKWYQPNQSAYVPDTVVLNSMEKNKGKVQFVLFGGTWCEDTQFILPKFFKLQEMSGISDDQLTFFGVNENKKSLGHITEAFGVTNVPTIIVMKDNKEVGRVVEYGKSGKWDKDLSDILNSVK